LVGFPGLRFGLFSFRKSRANYPTPWSFTPGHRGMDPKVQLEGGAKHLMMKEAWGLPDPTNDGWIWGSHGDHMWITWG